MHFALVPLIACIYEFHDIMYFLFIKKKKIHIGNNIDLS